MTETRDTFAGLERWQELIWYGLMALSIAVFLWGVDRLVRKYRGGRARPNGRPTWRSLARAAAIVSTHAWIRRRDPVAGLAHLAIFYGFLVLLAGTAVLAVQDDIARPIFGFDFWRGSFYLGYSLFLDVFGIALLLGLVVMALKRMLHPARLDYRRVDRTSEPGERSRYIVGDWVFVGTLIFLGTSGFVLEALRIAETDPSFETWSPAGWAVGQLLRDAGLDGSAAGAARFGLWWAHGICALAFVSAIPFTKAVHMMTGPASVAVRDPNAGRVLPLMPAAAGGAAGYRTINDLTPAHLLQLDACTKCGKCHEACPAAATGYPLSPRDLVLDLREIAEGSVGIRGSLGVGPLHAVDEDLVGGTNLRADTVWSCFQCMACVEICPVGVEHVPIINGLRRQLVDRGEMDPQLQSTLEAIFISGNSFNESKRKRAVWTRELDFEVKDIRKTPAEILWFVGDYASFDPRNQRITRMLARLLRTARVDFGILYDGERNAGYDVRRIGEEGLFTELVDSNMSTIGGCSFERILTTDPHTYHTLKHEYPQFGATWPVLHHSELLLELLLGGRLAVTVPQDVRVTYHDPCALGRYSGVFEAPRKVLAMVGAELREMPRNRDNSFCCGAGGGRIWMTDPDRGGAPRPSELRIEEALSVGPLDYFVVSCPKDLTMYDDAIKTSGRSSEIRLRELTELVCAAVGAPSTTEQSAPVFA